MKSFVSGKSIISQTYVTYDSGDIIGFLLGHCTLIPIYILAMYVTLLVTSRDAHILFAFSGQILCLIVNKLLKEIINEPRPVDSELEDSGMPSNHAQFMFYFAVYNALQLLFRDVSKKHHSLVERTIYSLMLLSIALTVCYSRVYLGNHSLEQVLVGLIVGTVMGAVWFLFDVFYGVIINKFICGIPFIHWIGFRDFSPLEHYHSIRKKKDV